MRMKREKLTSKEDTRVEARSRRIGEDERTKEVHVKWGQNN